MIGRTTLSEHASEDSEVTRLIIPLSVGPTGSSDSPRTVPAVSKAVQPVDTVGQAFVKKAIAVSDRATRNQTTVQ
jgi:hypothetical protein